MVAILSMDGDTTLTAAVIRGLGATHGLTLGTTLGMAASLGTILTDLGTAQEASSLTTQVTAAVGYAQVLAHAITAVQVTEHPHAPLTETGLTTTITARAPTVTRLHPMEAIPAAAILVEVIQEEEVTLAEVAATVAVAVVELEDTLAEEDNPNIRLRKVE